MQLVNLTPHALPVLVEDPTGDLTGSLGYGRDVRESQFRLVAELPSVGVARASTSVEAAGELEINGTTVPVTKTVFGQVINLPEPRDDIHLVVSLITANAAVAAGRTSDDLLVIGETVRDAKGMIIGTTGFGTV